MTISPKVSFWLNAAALALSLFYLVKGTFTTTLVHPVFYIGFGAFAAYILYKDHWKTRDYPFNLPMFQPKTRTLGKRWPTDDRR